MTQFAALGLVVCLCLPVCSGQTKSKSRSSAGKPKPDADDTYSFRDAEMRLILDYYRPGGGHPPPGSKKSNGAAGAESQIKRNGALPVGIESLLEPLPDELARQLPPAPAGCRRAVVGYKALLVQDSTKLVMDLLPLPR